MSFISIANTISNSLASSLHEAQLREAAERNSMYVEDVDVDTINAEFDDFISSVLLGNNHFVGVNVEESDEFVFTQSENDLDSESSSDESSDSDEEIVDRLDYNLRLGYDANADVNWSSSVENVSGVPDLSEDDIVIKPIEKWNLRFRSCKDAVAYFHLVDEYQMWLNEVSTPLSPDLVSEELDYGMERYATLNYQALIPSLWKNIEQFLLKHSMMSESTKGTRWYERQLMSNPYALLLRRFDDDKLVMTIPEEMNKREIMLEVYRVRRAMDDESDHGALNYLKRTTSEGLTISRMAENFSSNWLVHGTKNLSEDLMVKTQQFFDYVWTKMTALFEYVSQEVLNQFNLMKKNINSLVWKLIKNAFCGFVGHPAYNHELNLAVCGTIVYIIVVLLRLVDLIAVKTALSLMNGIKSQSSRIYNSIVSEGGNPVQSLIGSLCIGLYDMSDKDYAKVSKMTNKAIALLSTGSIIYSTYQCLLCVLPSALKMAITLKFGTSAQRTLLRLDTWRAEAQTLVSVSKVQSVVVSEVYGSRIKSSLVEGNAIMRLLKKESNLLQNSNFMSTYVQVFRIATNLYTRKYNAGGREVPFAFHIGGLPGIGKSTVINNLIRAVTDFSNDDIYCKPIKQEYASGYLDQPVFIWDEYLLTNDPMETEQALCEYLTMVSCGDFRPNYASVDDPNCGIKGNVCRPKVVVTMNNSIWDAIPSKFAAVERRRNCVVHMKRSDRYIGLEGNNSNVDLLAYTEQERLDMVWAQFIVLPPTKVEGVDKRGKVFTLPELKHYLRGQYQRHNQLQQMVRSEYNENSETHQSPEEILDEVFREVFDLPERNYDWMEAIKTYMGFGAPIQVAESRTKSEMDSCHEAQCFDTFANTGSWDGYIPKIQRIAKDNSMALGVVGILAACAWVSSMVTGKPHEMPTFYGESQTSLKESTKSKRVNRVHKIGTKDQQQFVVSAESLSVEQVHVRLCTKKNAEGVSHMELNTGIAVKGRWILTVWHPLAKHALEDFASWSVFYKEREFSCEFNPEHVFVNEECDFALFYMANSRFPEFKSKVSQFITEKDLDSYKQCYVKLDRDLESKVSPSTRHRDLLVENHGPNGSTTYTLKDVFKYHALTSSGWCGTPVQVVTGPMTRKILGIHVAGVADKSCSIEAYGTFITQEALQSVFVEAESMNVTCVEEVPYNLVVNLPQTSKITPSFLYGHLSTPQKQPAILTASDPRSGGVDPIERSLEKLDQADGGDVEVDQMTLDRLTDCLIEKYSKNMKWPVGKRQLSFQEAINGIPGVFNAIKLNTSAGFPLSLTSDRQGKKDFIWREDGEIRWDKSFEKMCLSLKEIMLTYQGEEIEHRFLAFLKDELRTMKKIDNVETRMIFANDICFLVVSRMLFGSVMIALRSNFETTGFALGLNQYSFDMHRIFEYLKKFKNLIDGDYSGFDQHYLKQVERSSYRLFFALCKDVEGLTPNCFVYAYKHETEAPFQIGRKLVHVKCSNKSGCVLTDIINCISNNLYIRYCFVKEHPYLSFDEYCRLVVLGDDHVLSVKEGVNFTPKMICERMKELGQVYTSADKTSELTDSYKTFDDIMFLGAHPKRHVCGRYSGALRKETLEQTPMYTKDKGLSTEMTCQQMLDCASQWDQEYYNDYLNRMKSCFDKQGLGWFLNDNYHDLRGTVAERTSDSGADYVRVWSESSSYSSYGASRTQGLTKMPTSTDAAQSQDTIDARQRADTSKCLGSDPLDLNYGVNSFVRRSSVAWASTDTQGTELLNLRVPFELLALLDQTNLQNMPFMNAMYSAPDIEVMFQVNGLTTQSGLAVAYFVPMDHAIPHLTNMTTFEHVFLTPNQSISASLKIPFRYFANCLNNFKGFTTTNGTENIGAIYITVLNPLQSAAATDADITVYSRFDSQFWLPRQAVGDSEPAFAEGNDLSVIPFRAPQGLNGLRPSNPVVTEPIISEGLSLSKNNYNISKVAGDVPIESSSVGARVSLPLDNPPLSSGAVPMVPQYPGMSKVVGLEPTVTLGEHPAQLYREPDATRNVSETLISDIMSRRNLLGEFSWTTSNAIGASLGTITLDSTFLNGGVSMPQQMPPSVAILNQFLRWKADIVFELQCVRTPFHTGRLVATVAYGVDTIGTANENVFLTQILDFDNENSWASVRIPYNCQFEFLRTFEGSFGDVLNYQEYCLGLFRVSVANTLKIASTLVSATIPINLYVKFENVQLYGLKPFSNIDWDSSSSITEVISESKTVSVSATAGVPINPAQNDVPEDIINPVSATSTLPEVNHTPCRLNVGAKFEYLMEDITEWGRRHTRIDPWNNRFKIGYVDHGATTHNTINMFSVYPRHPCTTLYAGWSGTMKYRIFVDYSVATSTTGNKAPTVTYVCHPNSTTDDSTVNIGHINADNVSGSVDSTWNATTRVKRNAVAVWSVPEEKMMPLSTTSFFIDVSVPYNSNYSFLPTRSAYRTANWGNGSLVVQVNTTAAYSIQVYQAFGDDFRWHCWCPVELNTFYKVLATSGTAAPDQVVVGTIVM